MEHVACVAYAAAAVLCAAIAAVTWRRRAQSPTVAAILAVVMLGGCWWAAADAVAVGTGAPVASIAFLMRAPAASTATAAFVCLGIAIARPQWVPTRRVVVALGLEPVVTSLMAVTNPWYLLLYRGVGAVQMTGSRGWTGGPVYLAHTWYCYVAMSSTIALLAWDLAKAPPAFRAQRLAVLLAGFAPLAVNMIFMAGTFGPIPDPSTLSFAVTGAMMCCALFRKDLLTFSPVARALIVDQVGDAVVVVSPGGRFLDLNPAGIALVRGMLPEAPAKLVGAPAGDLFGERHTTGRDSDLVVALEGGPAEYHVRMTPIVDRHGRALGNVHVARDVTQANALGRRLAAAHTQLVGQVETIEALRADLVEQASRDPLTGLHNRRYLVERFVVLLAAAEASAGTLTVVVFDLDRFKQVNDEYGHLAGDAVLVAFALRMARHSPPDALVARWGGEEFFVALPGADAAAGLAYADDVRRRCAQDPIQVGTRSIRCTVSGGLATYPASGTTMDDLFRAADTALYEAKAAGRDVVRSHGTPVTSVGAVPTDGCSGIMRSLQARPPARIDDMTAIQTG